MNQSFDVVWFGIFIVIILVLGVVCFMLLRQLRSTRRLVRRFDLDASAQRRMVLLQKAMLELSTCMTQVNGLNELLDIILQKAIEVIPEAQYGSILVMNVEGQLEFRAIYGFDPELFQVKLNPVESYQWRATGGKFDGPIIIRDLLQFSKDTLSPENYDEMCEMNALQQQSTLSAPLLIDGRYFGSINLDSVQVDVFKEEHKNLMAYFANQAIIAIRNHQYYEDVSYLSKHDSLTGVMNRHRFQDVVEKLIRRFAFSGETMTLVLIDLDRFKTINDRYGHPSGDQVLLSFAKSFSTHLRPTDLFARHGGDEFIAVFVGSDRLHTARRMQEIHEAITSEPIELHPSGEIIHCLFSYGLAEFPAEASELKNLIHLADQRMYVYKNRT